MSHFSAVFSDDELTLPGEIGLCLPHGGLHGACLFPR